MKKIIQANIDWFERLLETEAEPGKRAILLRLLAEEELKMNKANETSSGVDKAY